MTYTQKIIKVGNSAAITIPREFLKETGLKVGDEMALETNNKLKYLFGKPKNEAGSNTLTPEFKSWLNSFVDEYRPILKKLANITS